MDFSAIPAAVARAIAVGALFVLFGSLLRPGSARLAGWAAAVGLVGLAAWFLLVASSLIGGDLAATLAGLPLVAETLFGRLVAIQAALVVLAGLALLVRQRGVALLAGGIAVAVQAAHLHATAMYGLRPSLLLASEILHVLGGALWIGALPALLLVLWRGDLPAARNAARRFGGLAALGVALLAVSAAYQAVVLLGGVAGALGTDYGRIAIAKMVLFVVLLGFAACHRLLLLPRLYGTDPRRVQAMFARSVAAELAVGTLAVALGALLSTAPPGMHM